MATYNRVDAEASTERIKLCVRNSIYSVEVEWGSKLLIDIPVGKFTGN